MYPLQLGHQGVRYHVQGGWGRLGVTQEGDLVVRAPLDREGPMGEAATALVVAVDEGGVGGSGPFHVH